VKTGLENIKTKPGVPELPIRQAYDSDETYALKLELHALDVKEAACKRTQHTSRSATAIERADNFLAKLPEMRRQLMASLAPELAPQTDADAPVKIKTEVAPRFGSLEEKREHEAKLKFLDGLDERIAAAEAGGLAASEEAEQERMARIRAECDPCTANPHPWKPKGYGETQFKRTPAQKKAQDENWQNQHTSAEEQRQLNAVPAPKPEPVRNKYFAYQLPDGTTIWADGSQIKSPLQKETKLLQVPFPPGYVADSGVIPEDVTLNPSRLVWLVGIAKPVAPIASPEPDAAILMAGIDPLGLLTKG
jgi:hypothetical protein